jgi:3-hydroxybutyryl-CoA dehydrogenase
MNILTLGVTGAGTMGHGIAQVAAVAGFEVILHDLADSALERARTGISRNLDREVEKGKLSPADRAASLDRIRTTGDHGRLADADFVIEAVREDETTKSKVLRELDQMVGPGVVLASNTSSISITRLGAATRRPGQVVGMHFMNPVPRMPLVEIVRGLETTDDTVALTRELSEKLAKTPVVVSDAPGFVSNRLLMPMINEAITCLMESVGTRESIDRVMELGMNHPMGPLALADLIGLDVCLEVMEVLHAGFGDPRYRPCPLLRRMVDAGHLGRKSGRGFYTYG